MAKKHTLAALLSVTLLMIMIMVILVGINVSEKGSFEDFYDNNGGLLWGILTIVGILIGALKYLDIQREIERKISYDKTVELQSVIILQNEDIKKIHIDHIKEYGRISKHLSENTSNDTKVLKEVITQTSIINNFISQQESRDKIRDQQNGKLKDDVDGIKKEMRGIKSTLDAHIKNHKITA